MITARVAGKTLLAATDVVLPRLRGPRILIYHQVGSGRIHEMNVGVESFRRQLDWLLAFGEIVSLEEAIKRRGELHGHRLVVLTFDDGYADMFCNAFPILKERGLPFTLYLTSGPIETPDQFPRWPGIPLKWDQVRAMVDSGLVTIGAHTHTHPDLRHVGPDLAASELERSDELIAHHTGVPPEHFTYPKGYWSASAHEFVRTRYRTATVAGGKSISALSDLHILHRVPVQQSDIGLLFGQKMRRGARSESLLRRRLRGYDGP